MVFYVIIYFTFFNDLEYCNSEKAVFLIMIGKIKYFLIKFSD